MYDKEDIMEQETFIDEETGQALKFNKEVDGGSLFRDDEDVFEFKDLDTGGRRHFALKDIEERLKPKDF